MEAQRSERGQVLVLILFAIVVIMGFAALAVDGGQIYAERRRAQNAADSAALAAANAFIAKQDTDAAAMAAALTNGFGDDPNDIKNNIPVENRKMHVAFEQYAEDDDYEYFKVTVDTTTDSIFSQFITGQSQRQTVEAVARVKKPQSVSAGNVMHATMESGDGIDFNGAMNVTVKGGHIYSASNADKNGQKGNVVVEGGRVLAVGGVVGHTEKIFSDLP
ncbi:MAG TPA: Tad domain-containing protein, partial [Bacillota bacterium]|nr:Tad domain-containing protein [Bacillota bacterium]